MPIARSFLLYLTWCLRLAFLTLIGRSCCHTQAWILFMFCFVCLFVCLFAFLLPATGHAMGRVPKHLRPAMAQWCLDFRMHLQAVAFPGPQVQGGPCHRSGLLGESMTSCVLCLAAKRYFSSSHRVAGDQGLMAQSNNTITKHNNRRTHSTQHNSSNNNNNNTTKSKCTHTNQNKTNVHNQHNTNRGAGMRALDMCKSCLTMWHDACCVGGYDLSGDGHGFTYPECHSHR